MTTSWLDFTRTLTPGGTLEFVSRPTQELIGEVWATAAGASAAFSADVIYQAVVSASSASRADAQGSVLITCDLLAAAPAALFVVDAEHDINAFRGPSSVTDDSWKQRAAAVAADTQSSWERSDTKRAEQKSLWQQGSACSQVVTSLLEGMEKSSSDAAIFYQQGTALAATSASSFSILARARDEYSIIYEQGNGTGAALVSGYQYPPRMHQQHDELWQVAEQLRHALRLAEWGQAAALMAECQILFEFGRQPPPGRTDLPKPPITPEVVISGLLAFSRPYGTGGELEFYWSKPAKHVIPTRRYYIVINSAQLIRARDGLDIPASSVRLEVDRDSTSWQFSATVPSVRLAELMEGEEAIIEVNGHSWRCVVDGWSDNRSFNQSSATITGRSLSAKLSSSLALTRSHAAASPAMLQQLAQAELGEQWVLQWDAADWLIPGGIWSYQNQAPLDAIKTLAEAAGGFVLPDMASHKLRVLPRYKNVPWDITEADIQIPEAIMLAMGRQRNNRVAPNGVWVTGGNAGITAFIRRDGTAGNILVDDVTNPLITHAIGARALGSRVIISAMPSSVDSLELPLSDDTGLILPGQTIALPSGYGYSHGVKITAGRDSDYKLKVRQSIEVERVLLEA